MHVWFEKMLSPLELAKSHLLFQEHSMTKVVDCFGGKKDFEGYHPKPVCL